MKFLLRAMPAWQSTKSGAVLALWQAGAETGRSPFGVLNEEEEKGPHFVNSAVVFGFPLSDKTKAPVFVALKLRKF